MGPAEEIIPLRQLARRVGRHYQTLWRWVRFGCRNKDGKRVRLKPTYLGGTIHVKESDWDKFIARL